jgi:hypothetical protein
MDPAPIAATTLASFTDDRLFDLLLTAGDTLPREAVDEFVRRGDRVIEPLAAICRDPRAWQEFEEPLLWRPLHATFILGAIGGPAAVPGLVAALRHSAEEHDRVAEMIPSILGAAGPAALPPLLALARDRAAEWSERFEAILSIAALAARHPAMRDAVLDELRAIAEDPTQRDDIRGDAANALLDFIRPKDREFLLARARLERRDAIPRFDASSVAKAYERGEPDLGFYFRDWLEFYRPLEGERR